MKRFLVPLLIVGLAAGTVATAEAKKKAPKRIERVVEVVYDAPAIGVGQVGAGACLGATNSCGLVAIGADDRYMKVEVTDSSGTTVQIDLGQDTDEAATGTEVDLGTVCGASTEAIPIQAAGVPITTFPWAVGGAACPGVGTTGTIKFTFSNLP
jgi:hypothetical protein